jgi:protein SCO1
MVSNVLTAILKPSRMAAAGLAAALLSAAPSALGQSGAFQATLNRIGIEQKLGGQVPPGTLVTDENGHKLKFGELLGKRAIVLLPIFYNCQGVCGREAESLLKAMIRIEDKTAGKDYDVVALSIHPKETPELALSKKAVAVDVYGRPGSENGFHFLTADEQSARQITDAIGFKYEFDAKNNRVNHPAGIMVLTPSGRVSQYLFGAQYAHAVVRSAIITAGQDKLGRKAEVELLGCVMIDPVTGKRSLVIENFIRLISAAFAVGVFSWIGIMSFRNRRPPAGGEGGPSANA